MGALSITVAGSVLSTSLVVGLLGHATIGIHLDEVESAVESTGKVGHVDIESELLVKELEHLVFGLGLEEVDASSDVSTLDELEGESIAGGGDTVGAAVVSTVDGAVLGAGHTVGADGGVPGVAGVAVGVTAGGMEPAPVGVEHDGGVHSCATALSTFLRAHFGVGLGGECAGLLAVHHREEGEGDESSSAEHDEMLLERVSRLRLMIYGRYTAPMKNGEKSLSSRRPKSKCLQQ